MAQDPPKELNAKEARQGTRPFSMLWVLIISTVVAAIVLYLIMGFGWTWK